jgi:hypothetical protein
MHSILMCIHTCICIHAVVVDSLGTHDTHIPNPFILCFHQLQDLRIVDRWRIKGTHYARTLEAWCVKMDECYRRGELQAILAKTYGQENVVKW